MNLIPGCHSCTNREYYFVCVLSELVITDQGYNPINKWVTDMNRHCLKDEIQMVSKHTKVLRFTSCQRNVNENQGEFHFSVRMSIIHKSDNNKCWQGYSGKVLSSTVAGNVDQCNRYRIQYADSSLSERGSTIWTPTPGNVFKWNESACWITCTSMVIAVQLTVAKPYNPPTCPPTDN